MEYLAQLHDFKREFLISVEQKLNHFGVGRLKVASGIKIIFNRWGFKGKFFKGNVIGIKGQCDGGGARPSKVLEVALAETAENNRIVQVDLGLEETAALGNFFVERAGKRIEVWTKSAVQKKFRAGVCGYVGASEGHGGAKIIKKKIKKNKKKHIQTILYTV